MSEGLAKARAAVIAATESPDGGASAVATVCAGCVELIPVDGAALSAMDRMGRQETLYASDPTIASMESLQFTLGEGPSYEAFTNYRPVLIPDIADARRQPMTQHGKTEQWPTLTSELSGLSIGAIFAFPVQQGAIHIGALTMYRVRPGWLSKSELGMALRLVDLAALALLGALPARPESEAWLAPLPRDRAAVHQATGVLISALHIPADHALSRLRGYAFSTGRPIEDVAKDLVGKLIDPNNLDT